MNKYEVTVRVVKQESFIVDAVDEAAAIEQAYKQASQSDVIEVLPEPEVTVLVVNLEEWPKHPVDALKKFGGIFGCPPMQPYQEKILRRICDESITPEQAAKEAAHTFTADIHAGHLSVLNKLSNG